MELPESSSPSTVVVKIVKISPAAAPCRSPNSQHTVSILDSSGEAKISFSAVYQPSNLLERPKVFHQDVLASLLAPESSQHAVRTALQIFMAYRNQSAFPILQDMFEDHLGLSEGLTILQMENGYNALLVALDANQDEELLPPEGYIPAGPITPEAGAPVDNAASLSAADTDVLIQPPGLASAKDLLRIATSSQQHAAPLPAGSTMGNNPSDATGAPRPEGQLAASWGSKTFLLVWADTAEPVRLTPSVLLAHLILCSRREAGMFLRMASGLGFCQVGDYVASLFFLFRRKGHRLKCWECGVKKKAPCGQTQRDDLPWCCHRRLGEWIALHTVTRAEDAEKSITFQNNGKFFLSLLPPKKVLDAPDPVGAQLRFAPDQSEVVRLSEIMKDRPYHPSLTLQKALTRLAPTCRKLWNQMDWISGTVAQVVGERSEEAATRMHLWLERTAFYKVPKSHQDEVADECLKPFEQLIDELLPEVDGAPNLGGHNRSGESIKATKAKQKMQQLQADSNAAPLALRAGPASGNVAQAPDANTLHSSMAIPHEAAWGQAPLLAGEGVAMPSGGAFLPRGQPHHAMSQGPDSTSQLHPGAASAAPEAMPSGLDGWGGGQVPGMFGSSEGAASGNAPAAGQSHLEQPSRVPVMVTHDVSSPQAGASMEREYTVNGKRKPLSNTGQGRRRLNARAALRAAGQDKQPQTGPVATSPHPHPQPTQVPTVAARQPSLDMTESGTRRKSKAMAGAYSSTYSKMQAQAQGHLLQPTMQPSLAQGATLESEELLPPEADKAVAEAGFRAFRSALSMSGSEQPIAEPLADSASTHGKMLAAPAALQGKKLRLGKKRQRGERNGNDTESGDDQAGSPLHVLSDAAQKECNCEARPEAAAVDGAQNRAFSRMQTRHGGSTASAAPSLLGQAVQDSPRHHLQSASNAEGSQGAALTGLPEAAEDSSVADAVLQEDLLTGLPATHSQAIASEGSLGLGWSSQQGMADSPHSTTSASAPVMETKGAVPPSQGGSASRNKQQQISRLARKSRGRRKLDRLNYLFEAIEADKASDSETGHGSNSRGSHAGKSEKAQPPGAHGTQTLPAGFENKVSTQ